MVDDFHRDIIEITGAPGSGKTTFIEKDLSDKIVLLGGMPISYGTTQRVLASLFLSLYAIVTGAISLGQILWLVKKAATYDETLFARVNALRNSMTKFGYGFFDAHGKATLIVDEGVSHIPFILGLEGREINDFVSVFRDQLEKKAIVFIEAPPKELLVERISTRGHKRVRSAQDAEAFVGKNSRIAAQYRQVLLDGDFDVTFK